MRPSSLLALLFCALPLGCAGGPGSASFEKAPPPPYTAAQIREAHPVGTRYLYRIEAQGAPVVLQTMFWLESDGEGALIEGSSTTEDGEPMGMPQKARSSWQELRDHALFPPLIASREEGRCRVPAGEYECWVYTVETELGPTEEVSVPGFSRFYFAYAKPGPPVLLETLSGEETLMRMELLEYERP